MKEVCGGCSGKGVIEMYYHKMNGICFSCWGTGVKLTRKEREERKREVMAWYGKAVTVVKPKDTKDTVETLKIDLATMYNALHHSRFKPEVVMKQRRAEAQRIWNELKKLGEAPTLEEIQEIAAGLRVWHKQLEVLGQMERGKTSVPTLKELKEMGKEKAMEGVK